MFSGRVSLSFLYALLAFSLLAVATPWGNPPPTTSSTPPPVTKTITVTAPGTTTTASAGNCNTGSIQCCQSTESASSPAGSLLLGLLGIVVQGVDVLLGLDCSPITIIGVGTGNTCTASPVCCENNAVGGLISIGCIPITL